MSYIATICCVDGVEVTVKGHVKSDVERHIRALDHEGASEWAIEPFVQAEQAVRDLLVALGHDITREGLRDTPRRVARMLASVGTPEPFDFTTFASEGMDEMVVQAGISVHSLCEHHMLPFVGTAAVAYIPNGRIVGLSKLARAVKWCSAGLQNQERITSAVADMIGANLEPRGVGVVIQARHMCMEMRGVREPGALTTTSCMRGALLEKPEARAEFLRLAGIGR